MAVRTIQTTLPNASKSIRVAGDELREEEGEEVPEECCADAVEDAVVGAEVEETVEEGAPIPH